MLTRISKTFNPSVILAHLTEAAEPGVTVPLGPEHVQPAAARRDEDAAPHLPASPPASQHKREQFDDWDHSAGSPECGSDGCG